MAEYDILKCKGWKIFMPKQTKKIASGTKQRKIAETINRIYKNTAPILLGEAALFTVMSILMMVRPAEILVAVTFIIGAVLVLFGLYRVSMVFVSNQGIGAGSIDLFFGLITLILGVVFCAYPHGAAVGLIYIFVVLFLINSLRMLFFAINMARIGFEYYLFDLIFAIVLVCVAAVLLFVPNLVGGMMVWFVAIYLLLYAATDVYIFIRLWRVRRALRACA